LFQRKLWTAVPLGLVLIGGLQGCATVEAVREAQATADRALAKAQESTVIATDAKKSAQDAQTTAQTTADAVAQLKDSIEKSTVVVNQSLEQSKQSYDEAHESAIISDKVDAKVSRITKSVKHLEHQQAQIMHLLQADQK
jgi:hypothetical protein